MGQSDMQTQVGYKLAVVIVGTCIIRNEAKQEAWT